MRRFAFVIAIVGLFVLFLMVNSNSVGVNSYEDLEKLEVNVKVSVEGKVVEGRVIYEGTKLFELESGIELICECLESLVGKKITVEGIVEEYESRKQVRVLRIWNVD